MIKLLKNASVFTPTPVGVKDILVIGDKIARMDDRIEGYDYLPEVEVVDLSGKTVVPGYIDLHVHITGGGGEQGFASRVPEAQLSHFTRCGVTTVVGLLGTDGVTRSLHNLVAKARALSEEGITAYALTGSYEYPTATVTGSVERDIVMIPPFVGVKIAVSDHRSSNPTGEELIRLGTAARRAGLLSGTPGLVTMHMGSGKGGLDPVFYALDHSDIPLRNFLPTHIGRTPELMAQGMDLVRRGGYIDFTTGESDEATERTADKLAECFHTDGVTFDHISLSSDAFGSQPKFDDKGECIGLTYASPQYLHKTVQALVRRGIPLQDALKLLTSTPAHLLSKDGSKGCIAQRADADLLVLDSNLEIEALFARGRTALWNKTPVLKGRFE